MLHLKISKSHGNLGKGESPIVTKGILSYSSPKLTVLSDKPFPFKICLNKLALPKNLASCVFPGAPAVKFKKKKMLIMPVQLYV